jgi:hypothetical protein
MRTSGTAKGQEGNERIKTNVGPVCETFTCTCGGVPSAYSTAFAISSGSIIARSLKRLIVSSGIPDPSPIAVLVHPGLMLCNA